MRCVGNLGEGCLPAYIIVWDMQGVLEIFDALMLAWLYHSVGASRSVNSKEKGLPKSCQDAQQVLLKKTVL